MSEHDKLRERIAHNLYCALGECHGDSMCFLGADDATRDNWTQAVESCVMPLLLAEREAQAAEIARWRDNAETAERHLSLYRQAVNEIDDRVEYARPHLTRAELHALLARLSGALLSGAEKLPRATADAMRGGAE